MYNIIKVSIILKLHVINNHMKKISEIIFTLFRFCAIIVRYTTLSQQMNAEENTKMHYLIVHVS